MLLCKLGSKLLMRFITMIAAVLFNFNIIAAMDDSQLTVEELRIEQAKSSMPEVAARFADNIVQFHSQLSQVKDDKFLIKIVEEHAESLWAHAVVRILNTKILMIDLCTGLACK